MMRKTLLLLTILGITACGSSNKTASTDNSNDNIVTLDSAKITGFLVDPYISQARLCLDLNGNDNCDNNEQMTESGDDGSFTFNRENGVGQDTKIISLNRGSFEFPDYGYHNGIPYEVALQSGVPTEGAVIITPASTVLETINIDAASLALILNQFSDTIGKTFTGDDITRDPFAGMDLDAEIDATILARLKANLVIYAMLRTIDGFRAIEGYETFLSTFSAQAQQTDSAVYTLLSSMVNGISAGLNLDLLDNFRASISTANESIAQQSGGLASPIPALSGEVVLEVATAITDYLVDASLEVVTAQLLQSSSDNFETRFAAITQLANTQFIQAQQQLPTLLAKLGAMAYGAVNKEQIDSYTGLFAGVRAGIFNVPFIEDGYNCIDGHFAIVYAYNDPANPTSLSTDAGCTSNLPKQASLNSTADIEENMWANLPVGKVRVSEEQTGCTFTGTVKDETGAAIPYVPMYFAYPSKQQEMYVQTDASGEFSFTHIPILTATNHIDTQYFFGTYVGTRERHPAFQNKEAVSDFNIRCDQLTTFTFNPVLKDIVADTVITGNLDSNITTQDFRVEIFASVPTDTLSPTVIDRGWIRDSIEDETDYDHPYMDFDNTTRDFEIRKLAGGNYSFGIVIPATETLPFIEFTTETVNVPAGQTTDIAITVNKAAFSYTLAIDGGEAVTYSIPFHTITLLSATKNRPINLSTHSSL